MISKNPRAEQIVGKRLGGFTQHPSKCFCPICGEYPQLSEYNYFMWCPKCNIDIPEVYCFRPVNPEEVKFCTDHFLNIFAEEKAKSYLPNFMEDVNAKANLAYCIINLLRNLQEDQSKDLEFRAFRFLLFKLYKDLEETGINIKLPHYWYVDGPHIYLKGLPAVFKLKVRKSEEDPKIYKIGRAHV
jgi:hypothetical protein